MADTTDLEELAETCLATAITIKSYLAANGHPPMSFDQDAPSYFPPANDEIQQARTKLCLASKAMYDLMSGPEEIVGWYPLMAVCLSQPVNFRPLMFLLLQGPRPEYWPLHLPLPNS